MDGLEKLINTIISDAEAQAKQIKNKADLEAEEQISKAYKKAEEITEKIMSGAELEAANILRTADSNANLDGRKAVLAARRKCIDAAFEKAEAKLYNLSDSEYFDVILKLLKKHYSGVKAELILNERDMLRKTADFENQLSDISTGNISLSAQTGSFKGGFVLKYPTLEENCSFESILHTNRENLEFEAAKILFPEI